MKLEVHGMESATEHFVTVWGMHVSGFKSDKHCLACLEGRKDLHLKRDMTDGVYELANHAPYFYLFAWGRGNRRETNVHLAVRPQQGAVASVGSAYGVTFTICDAFALRVDRLPKGWMGLKDEQTQCRNFQFGVQQFGYRPVNGAEHPGSHSLLPAVPGVTTA